MPHPRLNVRTCQKMYPSPLGFALPPFPFNLERGDISSSTPGKRKALAWSTRKPYPCPAGAGIIGVGVATTGKTTLLISTIYYEGGKSRGYTCVIPID